MRALPFLILSVAFVSLAGAQEGLYVSEHNLTYSLGLGDFYVNESMVFEKPGDPFTFQGELYFLRGDAEDVRATGYPYNVSQTSPRKIILEFMISKGQKKKVTLLYRRSDLITEKEGVYVFRGLALGEYPWAVNSARIEFIAPEGYQFGHYSPSTGSLKVGDRESLIFTLSPLKNVSAILSGFPVEIEYADYKSLTGREIELSGMLISTAEFEVGLGNITLQKLSAAGENVTLYESTYAFSRAALRDARKNQYNALIYRKERKYYEAYSSAEAAGRLARLAIDEARKLRAAEAKLSLAQKAGEGRAEKGKKDVNPPVSSEKPYTDTAAKDQQSRYILSLIFAVALLAIVAVLLMLRRPETQSRRGPGIRRLGLKKRSSPGFDDEVERIKKRRTIASQIRELTHRRRGMEIELEEARRSLATGRITEKEYTRRRYNLLRSMGKIDAEVSRLEVRLEQIKKEGHD